MAAARPRDRTTALLSTAVRPVTEKGEKFRRPMQIMNILLNARDVGDPQRAAEDRKNAG